MRILCTAQNPYCGKWLFGAKQLSLHYKLVHAVYNCAECNEQFAGEIRLDHHNAEKHDNSDNNSDSSDEEPNMEDVMEITDSDSSAETTDIDSSEEVGFSWLA